MNSKKLIIIVLLTTAPWLNAGPFDWVYTQVNKHPYVATAVLAATGFSIYRISTDVPVEENHIDLSKSDSSTVPEVNQSPRAAHSHLLDLARKKWHSADIYIDNNGATVFKYEKDSAITPRFDPKALPKKSCLKSTK